VPKQGADLSLSFATTLKSFGAFEPSPRIAVAVSGGIDSLALTFLAHQWIKENGGTLTALHVDHRLRPESSGDANKVRAWLGARGIPCVILPWVHEGVSTAIQEQARAARYHLLTEYCKEQGIFHLFLAHHKNDQEETFFYRQSKGSGPEGLAGMSAIEEGPYVRLLRPLLSVPKSDLKNFIGDHPFINDPSNTNDKFWRAHFRKNSDEKPYDESFGSQRIKMERALARLFAEHVRIYKEGCATLVCCFKDKTDPFLQEKMLSKLLTTIGGHAYPVRTQVVQHLLKHLPEKSWVSAGGCLIRLKGSHYQIIREWGRIQASQPASAPFLWDGRFIVTDIPPSLTLKPLGEKGWAQIKDRIEKKTLPAQAFYSLPALFNETGVLISLAKAAFIPKNRLLRGLWVTSC
jgi:tRNA(Ile)-lysidine synthase